jgi:hypothetical protein
MTQVARTGVIVGDGVMVGTIPVGVGVAVGVGEGATYLLSLRTRGRFTEPPAFIPPTACSPARKLKKINRTKRQKIQNGFLGSIFPLICLWHEKV